MRSRNFIFIFAALLVVISSLMFVNSGVTVNIAANWSDTGIIYNYGQTYYAKMFINFTDLTDYMDNYREQNYCIDIVQGSTTLYPCAVEGIISLNPLVVSWRVPSETIGKTLAFIFSLVDDTNSQALSSNRLTISQGTFSDEGEDEIVGGECSSDSDCPEDFYSSTFCSEGGDVYRNHITYFCGNSGVCSSTATSSLLEQCTAGCENGVCITEIIDEICTVDEDCSPPHNSSNFCSGGDVYTTQTSYTCPLGSCVASTEDILKTDCPQNDCLNGACQSLAEDPDSLAATWYDQFRADDVTNGIGVSFNIYSPDSEWEAGIVELTGLDAGTGYVNVYLDGSLYKSYGIVTHSGTISESWNITKGDIDDSDGISTMTVKYVESGVTTNFSEYMTVKKSHTIICDISSGSLLWSNPSPTITEGSDYNAGMYVSGITAVDGTYMTIKIYDSLSKDLVSTQTVTVNSNTIYSSYLFEDLAEGIWSYYYTLDGCTSQQKESENLIIIVQDPAAGCTYNIGDGICCSAQGETCVNAPGDCGACLASLENSVASWLKDGVVTTEDTVLSGSANNQYQMKVSGIENAEGQTLYFDVYEYDALSSHEALSSGLLTSPVSGGEATATFSFNEADLYAIRETGEPPYKLYFKVRLGDLNEDYKDNQLLVDVAEPVGCIYNLTDGVCCESQGEIYPDEPTCAAPPMDISGATGSWAVDNVTMIEGTSVEVGYSISGITNVPSGGQQVGLEFWEDEGFLSSNSHTKTVYVMVQEDGTYSGTLTILQSDITAAGGDENIGTSKSPYEFYLVLTSGSDEKKLNDELEVFVDNTETCEIFEINKENCANYEDSWQCSADSCEVGAYNSGELIRAGFCDEEGIICNCSWNVSNNSCYFDPRYITSDGIKIGSCNYIEDYSEDDCSDNYLHYTWDAIWNWDSTNVGFMEVPEGEEEVDYVLWSDNKYYYDPLKYSGGCEGGENTIACPAQVQLSGFNWVNLIVALVIVGIGYYLFELDKRKRSKTKSVDEKSTKKQSEKLTKKSTKKSKGSKKKKSKK